MSTRAHIVYQDSDGIFHFRFHRWDGYIRNLGINLFKHVNNPELVKKLFKPGLTISSTQNIKRHNNRLEEAKKTNNLKKFIQDLDSTENREINGLMVKFFKEEIPDTVGSFKELKDIFNHCTESFTYLYKDNHWSVSGYGTDIFVPLSKMMKIMNAANSLATLDYKEINLIKLKPIEYSQSLANLRSLKTIKAHTIIKILENSPEEQQKSLKYFISEIGSTDIESKLEILSHQRQVTKHAIRLEKKLSPSLLQSQKIKI